MDCKCLILLSNYSFWGALDCKFGFSGAHWLKLCARSMCSSVMRSSCVVDGSLACCEVAAYARAQSLCIVIVL
jgi:hypothetical protein